VACTNGQHILINKLNAAHKKEDKNHTTISIVEEKAFENSTSLHDENP
jgi:hypothetical protein